MKLKFFITLTLLFAVSACYTLLAQPVTVTVLPDSSVLLNLPDSIVLPKFGTQGWWTDSGVTTLLSAAIASISLFFAQLIPKFRKLNIATTTKVTVFLLAAITLVATVRGQDLWQQLFTLILGSAPLWTDLFYKVVVKNTLGKTALAAEPTIMVETDDVLAMSKHDRDAILQKKKDKISGADRGTII